MEEDGTELTVSAVDGEGIRSSEAENRIFMQLRSGTSDMQMLAAAQALGRFSAFESVDILQNKV